MPSVWQNNKILKKWEKKNYKHIVNGDFNYNLADPFSDPLINAISEYLNVDKEYIYVGTGISQFINAVLGMKCWNTIFLSNIEFALYKRTADINGKKVKLIESKYTNDFLINIKNISQRKMIYYVYHLHVGFQVNFLLRNKLKNY